MQKTVSQQQLLGGFKMGRKCFRESMVSNSDNHWSVFFDQSCDKMLQETIANPSVGRESVWLLPWPVLFASQRTCDRVPWLDDMLRIEPADPLLFLFPAFFTHFVLVSFSFLFSSVSLSPPLLCVTLSYPKEGPFALAPQLSVCEISFSLSNRFSLE